LCHDQRPPCSIVPTVFMVVRKRIRRVSPRYPSTSSPRHPSPQTFAYMKESILEPTPAFSAAPPARPPRKKPVVLRFLKILAGSFRYCRDRLSPSLELRRLAPPATKTSCKPNRTAIAQTIVVTSCDYPSEHRPRCHYIQLPGETRAYTQAPIFAPNQWVQ